MQKASVERLPLPLLAALGAAITFGASLVARVLLDLRGLSVDDAFIHLHIARNWAEGFGPVFNPGERVEASTSPAWLSLLMLQMRLGVPGEWAAAILEGLSSAAAGAVLAWLGALLGGARVALIAPAILAVLPAFAIWGSSGLETPLATAMLGMCIICAEQLRSVRGVAVLGLACTVLVTVRPETAVVGPLLLALSAWRLPHEQRLRAAVTGAAAFALPVGALLLLRHSYYGQWVPNTYVAKVAGIGFEHRLRGLRYVGKFVVVHWPLLVALPLLAAAERARLWRMLLVCGALLAGIAWSGGDHFYFQRLAVPVLVVLCLPLALLLADGTGPRRYAAGALVALQLPFALFATRDLGSLAQERDATRYLEELGRAFDELPPGMVASISIGAPAWHSRRPILDMVGLADPVIARSPRFPGAKAGHEHGDADYVMKRAPEFVLLFTWPTETPVDDNEEMRQLATLQGCCSSALQLIEHPEFRQRYEPFDLMVESGAHQRMWRRR